MELVSEDLCVVVVFVVGEGEICFEKMGLFSCWMCENFLYIWFFRDDVLEDLVDIFFFEIKVGYCEYFVFLFVFFLCMEGVLIWVVNGFFGGEYNEVGGYWIVW